MEACSKAFLRAKMFAVCVLSRPWLAGWLVVLLVVLLVLLVVLLLVLPMLCFWCIEPVEAENLPMAIV